MKVSLQQQLSKAFFKNLERVVNNTFTSRELSIKQGFNNNVANLSLFMGNHKPRL
jgi:hypothetical protein